MDEYLFITMAKLNADRQRLAREQRASEAAGQERKSTETETRSPRTRWFTRAPQWREQS